MKRSGPKRAILIGPLADQDPGIRARLRALKLSPRDRMIAVDRGLDCCARLGLLPVLAVGDWDSLQSRKLLRETPHITLPREKDRSDLFHALGEALRGGATEIVCLGLTGGRPDHHLAVLFELSEVAGSSSHGELRAVRALGPEADYHFVSARMGAWQGRIARGATVSVFSMGEMARGVTLKGFAYELRNADLKPSSNGLSNAVARARCEVSLRSGRLLVVIPHGRT